MFDWNDEELANIIWGEANQGDDHAVPFPDGIEKKPPDVYGDQIKKEWNQEGVNVMLDERKKAIAKCVPDGIKLENNSKNGTSEGVPTAGVDETASVVDGSENFQNRLKDMEEGDLVDYGWANIGSFDDLDRIFSNGGPIFGHNSIDKENELWSSSNDLTTSSEKFIPLSMDSSGLGLGALKSTSENFEVKREYFLHQDHFGSENVSDVTVHAPQNLHASLDRTAGRRNKLLMKDKLAPQVFGKTLAFNAQPNSVATPTVAEDKVNRGKKQLKCRIKSEHESEAMRSAWDQSASHYQQFDGTYPMPLSQPCPSPVLSHQKEIQGPESLGYKHFCNPLLVPFGYGSMGNAYPSFPVFSVSNTGEGNHQQVSPSNEVSLGNLNRLNKSPDTQMKPVSMTPQEKVEKLRRRQQMQAMLAIRKQQQQFTHHNSSPDCSASQKCTHENKLPLRGGNFELEGIPSTLPPLDTISHIEKDDASTVSIAIDDCSIEETLIYQLQDIISKLDIRIRLCIRDSLFRLAQSARERHCDGSTSSTSKSSGDEPEVHMEEAIDSNNRFARMPNVETQTNPIDRTVACFLFHMPWELAGKLPETSEFPRSTKLPPAKKTTTPMKLSNGLLPGNSETEQTLSQQGSTFPRLFDEGDQSKSSSQLDGGAVEIEASL